MNQFPGPEAPRTMRPDMASKYLHVHDPVLGYVPRAGVRGHTRDGGAVTIDGDGLRFSGDTPPLSDRPILAVGDSFTYGEDVGDLEAWPAQLQRLIGRRVLNGGVSGYGLDQIVLRTERLVARHRPVTAIISLIADDIARTEMRRLWWHDKPWFAVEQGRLVAKGQPVPQRTKLPPGLRRTIERLLNRTPAALQRLAGSHIRIHRAGTGDLISLKLVERLARLQATAGVKIVLMAQYDAHAWLDSRYAREQKDRLRPLLNGAASTGMATLDTFNRLSAEPRPGDLYGMQHMNGRGNLMIAGLLAARLRSLPD